MHIQIGKTLVPLQTEDVRGWKKKVLALTFSPDNKRLAVISSDRYVAIFDDNGDLVDRFSTKPNNQGQKNYSVRGAQFCPDLGFYKLAIAQSDNIVFVYKWANEKEAKPDDIWNGKKSICNKFREKSSVTCLTWPKNSPYEIVYGLVDGNIKVGRLRSNKSYLLYATNLSVLNIASNIEGNEILSAYTDGSIHKFPIKGKNQSSSEMKWIQHTCPAYALSWGRSICIAGNDHKVAFYDLQGNQECTFSYNVKECTPKCKQFNVAAFNHFGNAVVLGNFNSFYTFSWNEKSRLWEEGDIHLVENMNSVTNLSWKPKGSSLTIGTSTGLVDSYNLYLRRYIYKDIFQITYVSPTLVSIANQLDADKPPVILSSKHEIQKIAAHRDPVTKSYRYLVARTNSSLIFRDIENPDKAVSEVDWINDEINEKLFFGCESCCIICKANELSIIEYDASKVIASFRTEFTSEHLLSVQINKKKQKRNSNYSELITKKIAFLLDQQTINIKNVMTNGIATVYHDCAIDFLELNESGSFIIYRDQKYRLFCFDVVEQTKKFLLQHCNYVQWVPFSDVIVAQERNNMYVWYNSGALDQFDVRKINGQIDGIERFNGNTEVKVEQGTSTFKYQLVEEHIEFGIAMNNERYSSAVKILECIPISTQTDLMWEHILKKSITSWQLNVAHRSAAALHNFSLSQYLSKIKNIVCDQSKINVALDWKIEVEMFQLEGNFRKAEDIYLRQNKINEAITMYKDLNMFEEAFRLAKRRKREGIDSNLAHKNYLLNADQWDQTALSHIKDGKYLEAIEFYMNFKLYGKAADIIIKHCTNEVGNLLEKLINSLLNEHLFEVAGDVFDWLGQRRKAIESYLKANEYKKCIKIARIALPDQVTHFEEVFGDYLSSEHKVNDSLKHYIEAHAMEKAAEVSLLSGQWEKAISFIEELEFNEEKQLYEKIVNFYISSNQFQNAEKYLLKSQKYEDAVIMYIKSRNLDKALNIASLHLRKERMVSIFCEEASILEEEGNTKDAEFLYLSINQSNRAIEMYRKSRDFDKVLALVSKHDVKNLIDSKKNIGEQLQSEGNLKDAEFFFTSAGDWFAIAKMYTLNESWADVMRVTNNLKDDDEMKRIAYECVLNISHTPSTATLIHKKLYRSAIDYAARHGEILYALQIAQDHCPEAMEELHIKYAMQLQSKKQFSNAEKEFLKANKPLEAIQMYTREENWDQALRVANIHEPSSLPMVYIAHGHKAIEENDLKLAEQLFGKAGRMDLLPSNKLPNSQTCDSYKSHELNGTIYESDLQNTKFGKCYKISDFMAKGKEMEDLKQYDKAIEIYLWPTRELVSNISDLEKIWMNAERVASNYVPNSCEDVVTTISSKLVDIGCINRAVDVLYRSHQYESAVKLAIDGKLWKVALTISQNDANLKEQVENAIRNTDQEASIHLEKKDIEAKIDALAKIRNWDAMWKEVERLQLPLQLYEKYLIMHVQECLSEECDDKLLEALKLMHKFGGKDFLESKELIINLTEKFLHCSDKSKCIDEIQEFRKILFDIRSVSIKNRIDKSQQKDSVFEGKFESVFMAVNFATMLQIFESNELYEQAAQCAITMLQFSDSCVPADKLFYKAGQLCRKQKYDDFAFILFNHYIDIVEAIDEGESSSQQKLTNEDFYETLLVPQTTLVPTKHFVTREEDRDEIRDWVLSRCMDHGIKKSLPSKQSAHGTIYEVLYTNSLTGCKITGYPLCKNKGVMLIPGNNEEVTVSKRNWHAIVSKTHTCPWTGEQKKHFEEFR